MKKKITRFEIAMNNSLGMGIVKGGGSLVDESAGFLLCECSISFFFVAQAPTEKGRHDEVGETSLFSILVDGNDVDVVQLGNDIGFTAKTGQKFPIELTIGCDVWQKYLDG